MTHIYPYWRKHRKWIFTALIFLSLEIIGDLMQPTIVARIINQGVMQGDAGIVVRLGGVMLLVATFGAGCAIMRCVISSRVSQEFGANLRLDLFSKINRLSFTAMTKHDTAGVITRLTNDTSQLVNFTNSMMRIFVRAPALLVGAVIMTIILNRRLALILLFVVPVIALLMYISMKVGLPLFLKIQDALEKNNAVIREYLSGVRVVKAYNTFDLEVGRFEGTNTQLMDASIKAQRTVGVFFPIVSFAVNMGLVATLWFAGGWIEAGNMQVGDVIAFLNYMMQISLALRMIFNVYQMFIRAKASAGRVGDILGEEDVSESLGKAVPPSEMPLGIEFKNVSFTYPGGGSEPVLSDVSFKLPPGEILGIIGPTGAGKTTLVQLIPAFFAPTGGEIIVGEKPLGEIETDELRSNIAYCAQQNTLFFGPIIDNILMGKPDATTKEVERAAKAAMAHDFIAAYEDGYHTTIGQKGVNLSGGQKQRVGIARALIRKAPILILDDSVSAVDVETEAAIMKSIREINKNTTCVVVTQRISSVMNLNYIMVMEEGRVVGFGNHGELSENCRLYRDICSSQLI